MLESLFSFLASAASGGITGIIGAWLSHRTELAKMKELHRHQEVMADKDRELAALEAQSKLTIARTEAEASIAVADAQALAESYKHDRASYSSEAVEKLEGWWGQLARFWLVMVDVARGFIRPAATVYFIVLTTYLTYEAVRLLDQVAAPQVEAIALKLVPEVFDTVLYVASTVIFWWFGTRPAMKRRGG